MGLTEKNLRMTNFRWKISLLILLSFSYLILIGANISTSDYTLTTEAFHTIHITIEFFCIFVALCTFTVTSYSYMNNLSYHSYFIGLGLLAVGLIDWMHLYSYEGMPATLFSIPCPNNATLFHIIGRFVMVATFLVALFLYDKKLRLNGCMRFFMLTLTLGIVVFILSSVTVMPNLYPAMYSVEQGQTTAKIFSEYAIIILLVFTIIGYAFLYKRVLNTYLELVILSLIVFVFSELSFTLYYGAINVLGHLFRFASFCLIYAAIVIHNVKRPYQQLVNIRQELEKSNVILEQRVRERTHNLEQANKKLARAAIYDYLTGAVNRMEFSNRFSVLTENSNQQAVHSVLAIDFDSFKKINDTYGHGVGDACLKTFVKVAKGAIPPTDTVSRFGGDEFMILLSNTPKEDAKKVAEKIKHRLAKVADPPFTISVGIAQWPNDGKKEKHLLASADQALYLAKEKGKNRVE
ncbi:MASE3 domain-containing protein [Peptococcaceae bacterium 1198_IL3148]